MSEPLIMICGPALDADESAASLKALGQVTLPGAVKFLITTGKFDADGGARCVNVEADYPVEPARLRTLRAWAEVSDPSDPRFRDGYDLYCIRRILQRHGMFDYAVLLRGDAATLAARWPHLSQDVAGRLYLIDGLGSTAPTQEAASNLVIDLRDARAPALLDAAWQLFQSGAVYGIADYSFDVALRTAREAIELQQSLQQRDDCGESDDTTQPLTIVPRPSLAGDRTSA